MGDIQPTMQGSAYEELSSLATQFACYRYSLIDRSISRRKQTYFMCFIIYLCRPAGAVPDIVTMGSVVTSLLSTIVNIKSSKSSQN